MRQASFKNLSFLLLLVVFSSCKSSEFTGYSYDPEGVTETSDKEITSQHKRTIGFTGDGVWITNEFAGARVSDAFKVKERHYKIIIEPEISPINNSPWYGFKIRSEDSLSVLIELEYKDGKHRYIPKLSRNNGKTWSLIDSTRYHTDPETNNGFLELDLNSDELWVTAQEVHTTDELNRWLEKMSRDSFIQQSVAGSSHQGRPVKMLKISEHSPVDMKGVIIIYGRQHPPEIPGYVVSQYFMETLASGTELAREFRNYFDVWAFPMMNPDGADNGHWRTNGAGVDLNRDWQFFNQPETAAVRDALLPLKNRSDRRVFYAIDFHSTSYNVFYPILRNIETFPEQFTYRWAEQILTEMPGLELRIEPFDIDSPIAKNWTYKTFGSDAVTFEVGDEIPNDKLRNFAVRSAEIFMRQMIDEYKKIASPQTAAN